MMNPNQIWNRLSVLALITLIASGCNYNKLHGEQAGGRGGPQITSLDEVDFRVVQAQVIGPKCLSCHATATGNQGGTNLEGLQAVRSLLSRVSYRSLERRDMPPAGLGERETAILRTWIENGAPETIQVSSEKPDPTLEQGPNDWPKIRDRIFTAKCLDCHSGKEPHGGLDITTLEATRAKAAAIFDRVIVRSDMPIAPYPMLTPRERRVLLKWFDLGMPE